MGFFVLTIWVACAVYVQTRGAVSHQKLSRRITDHSNLFAPINCLFYLTSAIRNTPYVDTFAYAS